MKKRILLFIAIAGIGTATLSSYSAGPASNPNDYDCTGAESAGTGAFTNPTGCASSGSGCHSTSATTSIVVGIELDSAGGVPTTHYRPGFTYTVKLTGANTGTTNTKYGFQLAALKGTASASSNADAGTWATTGLPASTHVTAPTAHTQLTVAEHSSTNSGATFTKSFTWTAPAAGTGTISFWSAVNFVNGNGAEDINDKWNTNHVDITELVTTEVTNVAENISLSVFPNPVVNNLNINLNNATGNYAIAVIDLNGRVITTDNITASTSINTSNWAAGMYYVVVKGNASTKTVAVVKQ